MPVLIDDREDPDIQTGLQRFGIPTAVVRLDHGDLVIQAKDARLIAFERKRLDDMVRCMEDRRLAGFQLNNMRGIYDRVEIVFEGMFRPNPSGYVEIPRRTNGKTTWVPYPRGISFRQLDSFLYSQYECGGVPFWRTMSLEETVQLYVSRYHWWQKDYELHTSHDVIYSNSPSAQRRGAVTLHQGEPNAVTMVAAQIPGIDAKAWDVGKHFVSVEEMVNADEREWRHVAWTDRKGNVKHFGKETAKEIVQWFRKQTTQKP